MRRVREELALRIQNGGLTTQHDTSQHDTSLSLFGSFLTGILTLKWVKVSISCNFVGGDPSRSELIQVDPTRTGRPS